MTQSRSDDSSGEWWLSMSDNNVARAGEPLHRDNNMIHNNHQYDDNNHQYDDNNITIPNDDMKICQ